MTLHHKVQDLAFVVACSPQIHPLATDPADNLVQVPAQIGRAPPLLKPPRDQGDELDGPAPERLVADLDPHCASSWSTSRKVRLNPRYSHTAWPMTSTGNR